MKSGFFSVVLTSFLVGCATNEIVQISQDTYLLIKESKAGIFASQGKMKADAIAAANKFAEKQGKVAVPVSLEYHPSAPLKWPSIEYQFRVVDEFSSQAWGPTTLVHREPSAEQQVANELKRQNDNADEERRMRALQQLQQSFAPPPPKPAPKKIRCNTSSAWLPGSPNYGNDLRTECTED